MPITIQTNELSLAAQRHLNDTNNRLKTVIEKLGSGSRINRAADDAAGLAISDSLNADIRSLGQAVRNAQDGISLVQVYEGGTTEINNMVMRIRELAMQSSSDTVGERERRMLDGEVQQLKQEIERVAQTTKYAGTSLLNGSVVKMAFQVGVNNVEEVDRITFDPGDTSLTLNSLNLEDISILEKEGAQESLDLLDQSIYRVNDIRARIGSIQSRLDTTVRAQGIFRENLMAAKSRIRDTDMAAEASNFAAESILREAGVAVLAQANETPALALKLLRP